MTSYSQPNEIHIILVIWGQRFWDNFLSYGLSTRLTPNNFPQFCKSLKCTYKIYTKQEDINQYKSHPLIQELKKILPVVFIAIETESSAQKYSLFSKIQKEAVKESMKQNMGLIFDSPDHIYTNRVFGSLAPLIQQGKRLLLTPGIRLCMEDFLKDHTFMTKVNGKRNFENHDLVSAALNHLHPYATKNCFVENKNIIYWTSQLLFKLNKQNFAQLIFHPHPFYVWPQKNSNFVLQTIDNGDFLYKSCPEKKLHYTCKGEEFTYFELSEKDYAKDFLNLKTSFFHYIYWAKQFAHPKQIAGLYRYKTYASSKIENCFFRKLSLYTFLISFYLFSFLPKKIIHPFFYLAHKRCLNKPISFLYFLRKVKIPNYYEALLLNNFDSFGFEDTLVFVKQNQKKISASVLRRVMSYSFNHIEKETYEIYVEKILQLIRSPEILGQIVHESIKICNHQLVESFIKLDVLKKVSPKQLGYIVKELAIQNYQDLYQMILKDKSITDKIKSSMLQKSLPLLMKHEASSIIKELLAILMTKKVNKKLFKQFLKELASQKESPLLLYVLNQKKLLKDYNTILLKLTK